MKSSADASHKLLKFQTAVLYFLAAAVPLFFYKNTFSYSDLPKSTVLIITVSLFILLSGIFLIFKKNSNELRFQFVLFTDIPILVFLLAAIISFTFSINQYNSYYGSYERQIGLITYIVLISIYFSASTLKWSNEAINRLCSVLEAVALIIALYAIFQQMGFDLFELQPQGDSRPVSTIGNAVFTGGFLAIVLPISVFNLSKKKSNILIYLIPSLILFGIFVTRTRSAYIAVAAQVVFGLLITLIFYKKKLTIKKIIILLSVVSAVIAAFILLFPGNIYSVRLKSLTDAFDNPRWLIWQDAIGVFYKYPFTGPGLGNFPTAFSEFYSYQLRYDDVNRYIDNAHNNYLQILCTMGIIGLTGYISVIAGCVFICLKKIKEYAKINILQELYFYTALLLSFTGYIFYGLTNFDDLTIMLYFTLLIILVRSRAEYKLFKLDLNSRFKAVFIIIMLPLFVFLGYNIKKSVEHFIADTEFLNAQQLFQMNRFKDGVNAVNNAIYRWKENPVYRFSLAAEVYKYTIANNISDEKIKTDLLNQAAEEIIKAKVNHSNPVACDALFSLILFENGKTEEAERLKTDVLNKDRVNIEYRMNLAYYYIKSDHLNKSFEQIEEINKIGYQSVKFWYIQAIYYLTSGNKSEALKFTERILETEPENKDAAELLKKLK